MTTDHFTRANGGDRNTDLATLAGILQEQHARRIDCVVPAPDLYADVTGNSEGMPAPVVTYFAPDVITEEGVGALTTLAPNNVFHEGVAAKLGIPVGYVKRMAHDAPDLWATNVNHWLRDAVPGTSYFIRGFTAEDGGLGVARAMLSDSYRPLDNFDVLLTVLDGVRAGGLDVVPTTCDLTDRSMFVKFDAPSISMLVPDILEGYRNPYRGSGSTGDTPPVVHAGIVVSNSETGRGAFTICPRIVVRVCSNGMTRHADQFRAVHLGSQLESGVIDWSTRTQDADLALIRAKAVDAVSSFLNVDYLRKFTDDMRRAKGIEITDPAGTVERVAKTQRWTKDEAQGILAHFISGGDLTTLGVAQAVTSYVQSIGDADRADDLESQALGAALAIR